MSSVWTTPGIKLGIIYDNLLPKVIMTASVTIWVLAIYDTPLITTIGDS